MTMGDTGLDGLNRINKSGKLLHRSKRAVMVPRNALTLYILG